MFYLERRHLSRADWGGGCVQPRSTVGSPRQDKHQEARPTPLLFLRKSLGLAAPTVRPRLAQEDESTGSRFSKAEVRRQMNWYDRQRAQTEQRRSDRGCLIGAGVDRIRAGDRPASIRETRT